MKYMFNRQTILFFTDRLFMQTEALAKYCKENTDFYILGIFSEYSQAAKALSVDIDPVQLHYLVLCGYLRHESNYRIIKIARLLNPHVKVVHYAILDAIISFADRQYDIPYSFERTRSLKEFVQYLKDIDVRPQ